MVHLCSAGRDLCQGAEQVKDHDSMDLGLLVGVHFKVGDCNAISSKYLYSPVSSFPVKSERLVASDGESMFGVQVCL